MSKNKRNFITGLIGSGIIFIIGVLYVIIPSYYGVENLGDIGPNNLFISFILIYATVNISVYYIVQRENDNEVIWMSIVTLIVGFINIITDLLFKSYVALRISILALSLLIVIVRLVKASYYKKNKDASYYFEYIYIVIYLVIGTLLPFTLINNKLVEITSLGFYIVLLSILDGMNVTLKSLIKAPRFLGKIRF